MRHRYRRIDPDLLDSLLTAEDLLRLFNQLILAAGGDVEEAMDWMRQLQDAGYIDPDVDLDEFMESLQQRRMIEGDGDGGFNLSAGGERQIRRSAFEELFSTLERGGPGYHAMRSPGSGVERLPETRSFAFGDDVTHLDAPRSLQNALRRTQGQLDLQEEDLEIHETEHLTSCATVLAIDISHSMILYGEDRITPAKKVALALTELITTKYPKDHLSVILFGDRAEEVPLTELPYIQAGPYHTNTREGLQLARALLAKRQQPNKQIILITDGKPSAITEGGQVYKNPFGLDLKVVNLTLEEADQCRRQKVVITTFMLATDPLLTDFVEKLTQINRGRAFFASPRNLGEFILADYLRNRRRRVR